MKTGAIVLAAGRSSRFGDGHKLLASFEGHPMVRHVVQLAHHAGLDPVVLVTGHDAVAVEAAAGAGVRFVHNADFASGMASSIQLGLAALPATCEAVFLVLGDMPLVQASTLFAMQRVTSGDVVIPVHDGRRGNPVLVRRHAFSALNTLTGDEGARRLIAAGVLSAVECAVDDPGIHIDFDEAATLAAWRDGH